MWFEEGFASSAFRSATNLTNRIPTPKADRGGRSPSPHTHLPSRALRSLPGPEPSGQAECGIWRPARLARERKPFRALRPRAGWPGQRIQMSPLKRLRRSASGREAGAGRARGGATVPAYPLPGARPGVLPGGLALPRWVSARGSRPSPAAPTPGRLTPPRALSASRAPAPPRSRRLLPAPSAGPTSSAQAAGAGGGRKGYNPGLFPARRDPEPSRARC